MPLVEEKCLMFAAFSGFWDLHKIFLPIAGFNYGLENMIGFKDPIYTAIKYAAILATVVFVGLNALPK